MIDVFLRADRDRSVRRRHPWLLSGAIERTSGEAEPGAWARVVWRSESKFINVGNPVRDGLSFLMS